MKIYASPRERLQLVLIMFERGFGGAGRVSLRHGLDGRRFRQFMRELDLWPIKRSLDRWNGVRAKTGLNEERTEFEVDTEALTFFREHLADLPRTLEQEMVAGRLFDALHGLGPREPHEVAVEELMSDVGANEWEPPRGSQLRPIPGTISTLKLQALIDAVTPKFEELGEKAPELKPLLERFFGDVSDLAEYDEGDGGEWDERDEPDEEVPEEEGLPDPEKNDDEAPPPAEGTE